MRASGVAGSIVNVSSQASHRQMPHHATYSASKAAVDQLTRMMAAELGALYKAYCPIAHITPIDAVTYSSKTHSHRYLLASKELRFRFTAFTPNLEDSS